MAARPSYTAPRAAHRDLAFVARLVLAIAAALFTGELAIMRVLESWHPEHAWVADLADASVLAVLTIPVVYAVGVRPLRRRISRQVQALAGMVRHLEWLSMVFDSVEESISVTDPDGVILHVNPSFERITGYAAGEVIGQRSALLSSGEHNRAYYESMWASLRRTGSWQGRIVDRMRSGENVEFFLTISALRDEANTITGYVGIHRDMRRLLEHEQQLRVALEQQQRAAGELEEARREAVLASEAKSRFLSMMSHEIRTPLAGVLGTLELMSGGPLSDEQREYADLATRSARALTGILNDVLDFSKIEAMGVSLEHERFDLCEAALETRDLFLAQARRKGLVLELSGAGGRRPVRGDAHRLKQVLANLVGNAIKFTSSGFVRLALRLEPGPEGRVTAAFVVEDSGIGIPSDRLAHLFQPFVQAESSTHRRFGGTGLGLTISRRLVEAMGGTLTVQSTLGVGTTFEVRVAFDEAEESAPAAVPGSIPGPQRLGSIRGLSVLLAEDNPVNQLVISRLLQREGAVVTVAPNGAEAVEQAKARPFDVVLLDMQMPELDGPGAAAALRRLPLPAGTMPLVGLTANVSAEDHARCLASGMDEVLCKPVVAETLVATVVRLVERAQARPTAA